MTSRNTGPPAACETITRQELKDKEETITCCRMCGRYHLFGATEIIPILQHARVDPTGLG
jgi:hypothetical protein